MDAAHVLRTTDATSRCRRARAARSAEQQFNFPVSRFDNNQFRQTIASFFKVRATRCEATLASRRLVRVR
jgi:hypothetical protein